MQEGADQDQQQQQVEINEGLLDQNDVQPPMVRRMTVIFQKGLEQFKFSCIALTIFQFLKFSTPWIFISIHSNCKWEEQQWCVIGLMIHSLAAFLYYIKLYIFSRNKEFILNIAENLHHVYYIDLQQQEELENEIQELQQNGQPQYEIEEEIMQQEQQFYNNNNNPEVNTNNADQNRKISFLSLQIKYECKKQNLFCLLWGTLQFCIIQGLLIWAIVILLNGSIFMSYQQQGNNPCNSWAEIYIFVVLICGSYQYYDFYLGVIALALCLPFIIACSLLKCIKTCIKNKQNNAFLNKLKPILFKKLNLKKNDLSQMEEKSELECSICMANYKDDEKIIVLPCNGKHFFHETCIKKWLAQHRNCPYCRQNLGEQDIQGQNQQQFQQQEQEQMQIQQN